MVRKRQSTTSTRSTPGRRSSSTSATTLPATKPAKPATPTAPSTSSSSKPAGRSTGEVFKDMAATATGVAVGSAVGHAVGASVVGALSGRGGGSAATTEQPVRQSPELVAEGPCANEIRQFLKCSEENSDLSVCQGFNEAMRQCRQRYNV